MMGSGIKYSTEFKVEAVREVVERSRPVRTVAGELGIRPDTLRVWIAKQRRDGVEIVKKEESDLEAEIRCLRQELKDQAADLHWARQENEFLKKAAGFFAAEQRPERGSK